MNLWTISIANFIPSLASKEKHGDVVITELDNQSLIKAIIEEHIRRSPKPRTIEEDYFSNDYGDEIKIFVKGVHGRWRNLISLQFEGSQ